MGALKITMTESRFSNWEIEYKDRCYLASGIAFQITDKKLFVHIDELSCMNGDVHSDVSVIKEIGKKLQIQLDFYNYIRFKHFETI